MNNPTSTPHARADDEAQGEIPSKSETFSQKSNGKDSNPKDDNRSKSDSMGEKSHTKDDSRRIAGEKSSQGGSGNPTKASPAAIERFLKGIHFPAGKKDLVNKAKENKAPLDVLHVLDLFDETKEFHSPIDVAKEVGRVE